MHSTQAILPVLGEEFGVSPARAGLTISAVVTAVAAAAWLGGRSPIASDDAAP